MKLIKSRKNYTCYLCKTTINKGDKYGKKSFSEGKPWQPDKVIKDENGEFRAFEMQGIRWTRQVCEPCVVNQQPLEASQINSEWL